ncbi:hypothetical protein A5844_001491 [Enterococcus sp. 10A9_DIV0425]|uniref:Dihydrolipoamide dehydrogenase n=1 Tax=Candidatus Enterococcus wittei TaxID=1987383 RepID=A0A242K2T7_9ENTE|nr:dihydrolipoamide dehydrogenase [Enterococcus sp. 10A9_DIV0425]OTP11356.1 hypothetical protein A5844_001491 [Enterococcus sp. 10A9_DIV0425]
MEVKIDGRLHRIAAMQSLVSKPENQVGYALVFDDQSYVILDETGSIIEYGPASHSYPEILTKEGRWKVDIAELPREKQAWLQSQMRATSIEEKKIELLDCWIGLSEQRFLAYKKWQTTSGYLCGTYAAAVLLGYYQDYQNEAILPSTIRKKNSRDATELIQRLREKIQPLGLPTVPFQVSTGITAFLHAYDQKVNARSTMLGSWQRATKRIRQGKPVMVGILKLLGSTYGNHWVTAYAYFESSSGERFYKVHDNWGNHQRVIPASWGNGTVSLP